MGDSTDSTQPIEERPKWAARWLEVYRDTGNVRLACQACKIARDTPYKLKDRDPTFAADWEQAYEDACDVLEAEARRRALKSSDRLLELMVKSHRPKLYRETVRQEVSGPDGQPQEVKHTHDFDVVEVRITE